MSQNATAGDSQPQSTGKFAHNLPTPVCPLDLPGLGQHEVWLKNDGLSAEIYGGNKVRKLGPLLKRALERKKLRVVTIGAAGSHHVLATTLFAQQAGLSTMAFLFPQLETEHASNILRCTIGAGADVVALPTLSGTLHACQKLGREDFFIGPGGMGAIGGSGYFDAAFELENQVRRGELPEPDWIVVAAGSGSTAAGLVAGLCASSLATRVLAVAVAPNPAIRPMILAQAAAVLRARRQTRQLGRLAACLVVERDQVGQGYGWPTENAERAQEVASCHGLKLDPTYTAKAFAALLSFATKSPHPARLLFWNTLSAAPLEPLLAQAPPLVELPPALRRLLAPR